MKSKIHKFHKRHRGEEGLESYIGSIEERQKNVTWPHVLRNSRSVDEVIWKGVRGAPLVQRIGVAIFALAFLLVGITLVSMASQIGSRVPVLVGGTMLLAGAWMVRNAFRR
jgi:hypothetical protein